MAVDYETKKKIQEELEEQDITLHCMRATCMKSYTLPKKEYVRMLQEDGMVKCPDCNYRVL
jgi:DNA-directed RNA polymerase subunit RPC12/RpoP